MSILRRMNAKRLFAASMLLTLMSLSAGAVQITSVDWNTGLGVINVGLDSFPNWGGWRMLVDGLEVSMEGGRLAPFASLSNGPIGDWAGIFVCPNGPYPGNPSGLFIGTTPWVTPLPSGAMPC
ncbi:hypothetical protein IH601_01425, partial [Candidatus Bipolaricaulota bacterium]|nr:hypothetical protein [Candidatus Bipolaricaulota bacterium]